MKLKNSVFAEQLGLELVVLGRFVLLVRRNSAAAVDRSSAVGALDVQRILGLGAFAVVIIEERDVGVVTLDQAAAGRIVVRGRQRQSGVVVERENGLNQPLTESGFT